ncbi:bifunctional DNA-formamidopyrimidine glycosylase/DNA-(apurinic or apyrimidinic site) lyase [Mesorhizobium sp. LHD-90]|uniref:bifunctional DNA-formamidopyrimidine glycosylase/DNA-(apurinic or apyrimidinic site) lyase n=1 Tax=Mesorhizobium sp. LHD-90 TaxID=3071414 RepID=UPI0027DF2A4D|nr:bifunctional DNA-formamidopyrimidine glycosylase/DNA-(apurinic or apyrimidinic site) lyase [Mesorhizobium sp. LHD-90]MDQ6435582.1 bifunctional DNA-formamidopyrimidine glycosylase/DNA-(apurinic or apyrimidinic site) lyase [Mesorhizobium sp. LHD-90]
MPELPEVETVRRGLQPVMEGARIERIELRRKDLRFPFPARFAQRLEGRTIRGLGRRAKYLLVDVAEAPALICHLGMSGSFRIERDEVPGALPGQFHHERSKAAAHDHVVFHLAPPSGAPARVVFNDPRRFGFMLFAEDGIDKHPMLSGLGPEPTGNALDGALLRELLDGRVAPLKAALLDQRTIAGLGNIYVCEALWRAKLSPTRAAGSIAGKGKQQIARSDALAEAIRAVIAEAIQAGGSSLRDHIQADGSLGYFQHSFSVYDREGEPCPRLACTGQVERVVQSGRSTFYCRACQK